MVDEPTRRADLPAPEQAEYEQELEPDETRDFEAGDEVDELRQRVTELEDRLPA